MRVSQTFLLLTGIALASTLVASLAVPPAHIAPSPGPDTAQNSLHAFTMEKRQAFRPAPGPLGSDGTGFGVGGGRGYASKQEAHEEEADGNAVPEQPQEEQVEGQEGGQVSAATGTGTMSGETVVEIATQDLYVPVIPSKYPPLPWMARFLSKRHKALCHASRRCDLCGQIPLQ